MLIRRQCFGNRNAPSTAKAGTGQYFQDKGIGYHHAGLDKSERNAIEKAFADGRIKCLASTSTLAVGVNLPAHLVIVCGSRTYRGNGGYEDIPISQMVQMMGRAGRPGLDTTGVAVIMTDNESRKKVQAQLELGHIAATSKLLSCLPEVMNTEVSQRVVTNMEGATQWLMSTFLYCCLKHNSGIEEASLAVNNICREAIKRLAEIGLVRKVHQESIEALAGCHVMNQHLLSFEAMRAITSLPSNANQCQILRSLSSLEDLHSPVRKNEKKELREIHKTDVVKYKLPGQLSKFTVKDASQKAFILLQCIIGQHVFKNEGLRKEMSAVTNSATMILQAAQEYSVKASKYGNVARQCFLLQRSLTLCLWSADSGVLNQIEGVGATCTKLLRFHGIVSFQNVLDRSEEDLQRIGGRRAPFGRDLKTAAEAFIRDRLQLSAEIEYTRSSNTPAGLVVSLQKPQDATTAMSTKTKEPTILFTLIAYTDSPNDSCLIFEDGVSKPCSFRVSLPSSPYDKIFVYLLASVVGFDESVVLHRTGDQQLNKEKNGTPSARSASQKHTQERSQTQNSTKKRRICQTEISFASAKRTGTRSFASQAKAPEDPSPTITPPRDVEGGKDPYQDHYQGCHQQRDANNWNRLQTETTLSPNYFASFFKQRRSGEIYLRPTNVTPQVPPSRPAPGEQNPNPRNATGMVPPRDSVSDFWGSNSMQSQQQQINPERPQRQGQCSRNLSQKVTDEISMCSRPAVRLSDSGRQWEKSLKRTNQSQKRAYTDKSLNPFSVFTHNPNDSEKRLEDLSQKSSIIPESKLRTLIDTSSGRNVFKRDKNRKHRYGPVRLVNEREVLLQKANEQQDYSNKDPFWYSQNHPLAYIHGERYNQAPRGYTPPRSAGQYRMPAEYNFRGYKRTSQFGDFQYAVPREQVAPYGNTSEYDSNAYVDPREAFHQFQRHTDEYGTREIAPMHAGCDTHSMREHKAHYGNFEGCAHTDRESFFDNPPQEVRIPRGDPFSPVQGPAGQYFGQLLQTPQHRHQHQQESEVPLENLDVFF